MNIKNLDITNVFITQQKDNVYEQRRGNQGNKTQNYTFSKESIDIWRQTTNHLLKKGCGEIYPDSIFFNSILARTQKAYWIKNYEQRYNSLN